MKVLGSDPVRTQSRLYAVDEIVERLIRHALAGKQAMRLIGWCQVRNRIDQHRRFRVLKHVPWKGLRDTPPADA